MATENQKNCITQKGYSDSGKSTSSAILEAAAVAVAAINTAAAISMAKKQLEIAEDYLEIAKWFRSHYNNLYKPYEDKLIDEVRSLKPYEPNYDVAVGRARNSARLMAGDKLDRDIQCTSAYCTGIRNALLKDKLNIEAQTKAAVSGAGWRNEFAFMRAMEDLIWKRKEQMLNIGRDRMVNNVAFAGLAANIYSDLGRQAGEGAAGAVRYLGYSGQRNKTTYPATFGFGRGSGPLTRSLPDYSPLSGMGVPDGEVTVGPITDEDGNVIG